MSQSDTYAQRLHDMVAADDVQVAAATEGRSLENPSTPLDDPDVWDAWAGGEVSAADVRVSPASALKLSPVWRGVFLIANTVGKLPLYVYERDADGEGKHYATDHPAYMLLRRKPSAEITAFTFKQVVTAQAILQGNGYAYIDRAGDASPREIIPLPPDSCHPVRVNGVLYYVYTAPDGEMRKLARTDVYHIKGPGLDGLCGINLTSKAKDSLGSSLAAQTYAAKFFANGAEPRVVFETSKPLTDKQREQIKAMWQTMHAGLENAHKSGILENGVSIKAFGIDPQNSQLIETRKFSSMDVANWLNLPLPKVGYDGKTSTYASLEQETQNFLDDTMEPWLVQHEEQSWDKLLTEDEKRSDSHTVEFMRLALIRADAAARSAFYHNAMQDGWMSADEVRARENMNPIAGGKGKKYYRPLNMTPIDAPPPKVQVKKSARLDDARDATRKMLVDATRRMVKRLAVHARKAAKAGDLTAFVDVDLAAHRPVLREAMAPAVAAHAAVCGAVVLPAAAVDNLLADFSADLRGVVAAGAAPAAVEEVLARYEGERPERIARQIENLNWESNDEEA